MKALTFEPLKKGSDEVEDIPDPEPTSDEVLVDVQFVGICGTDFELLSGKYGFGLGPGKRMVLGHESLGIVRKAGSSSAFSPGDYVVAMVRHPDPEPCYSCKRGEWDMCRNGNYTEHGIKGIDGFMRESYSVSPDRLVKIDPKLETAGVLIEPTSVVAKAWEQVEKIGNRCYWEPDSVVITGAGPIGLLAAMIGVQKGYHVTVVDIVEGGSKPRLVNELGCSYHAGKLTDLDPPDVIIECSGNVGVVYDALGHVFNGGVLCLTGVSSEGSELDLDIGKLNKLWVLENEAICGSVNANKRHYEMAANFLKDANLNWLNNLITRKVSLVNYKDAFIRQPDDIKVLIALSE